MADQGSNSQDRQSESEFSKLDTLLGELTELSQNLITYSKGYPVSSIQCPEDAKIAMDIFKTVQSHVKFRFSDPVAQTKYIQDLTPEQRQILKKSLEFQRKGE